MSQVDGGGDLRFPDAPQLRLDELLAQLIDRAQDVIAAQGRLRGLLRALSRSSATSTCPRAAAVAEAACELVDARYGALGVIAPGGGRVCRQFITVGIDEHDRRRDRRAAHGKGSARRADRRPAADPVARPVRRPPLGRVSGRPSADVGFLGVPIRVRDEVFGNLYLTESAARASSPPRTRSWSGRWPPPPASRSRTPGCSSRRAAPAVAAGLDRRSPASCCRPTATSRCESLAAAGARDRRRRRRHRRAAELGRGPADGRGGRRSTGRRRARRATRTPTRTRSAGVAIEHGRSMLVADATDWTISVHLREPLSRSARSWWCRWSRRRRARRAVVGRMRGRPGFDAERPRHGHDVRQPRRASPSSWPTRGPTEQRIALLEDRDRIARDLHDHVIQRLFAAGLTVDGVARRSPTTRRAERLGTVVDDIDETIRQIRTSIFELRGPLGPDGPAPGSSCSTVVADVAPAARLRAADRVRRSDRFGRAGSRRRRPAWRSCARR